MVEVLGATKSKIGGIQVINIVVVVPSIREESLKEFKEAWQPLFRKHYITLIVVKDGEDPRVEWEDDYFNLSDLPSEVSDLIFNKNDGVRNLGFYATALYMRSTDYVITLDDDVKPIGDPIQDHIDILKQSAPITGCLNTIQDGYPRGFPYGIRDEAPVMVSHGLWTKNPDWDAPTQLVLGNRDSKFNKFIVPKGDRIAFCGMNVGFRREMLPYMYYAPMGYKVGLDRYADIWMGLEVKKVCDAKNWAMATGYSVVEHTRASNVFKNLQKEAKGLEINEELWSGDESDPYFKLYAEKRKAWEELINECTL